MVGKHWFRQMNESMENTDANMLQVTSEWL